MNTGKLTDIRVQSGGKKTNTQMVLAKRNGERQYIGLVSVDEEGVVNFIPTPNVLFIRDMYSIIEFLENY